MAKYSLALMLAGAVMLQGCVAAAVITVAGGATMANDKRSMGNQIDDQIIEIDAHNRLAKEQGLADNANLQVISLNGSVLVIGQTPNSFLHDLAIKTLTDLDGVVKLHDQIRIGNSTSLLTRSNDVWLTSKVKTALLTTDNIRGINIKVITENAEVFLMGLVSKQEADKAVEIARNISGVNRVIKAFEYQ